MYTAKIETAGGEILTLTGHEAVYQVIDISGLNPPPAQINTSTIVGMDGAVFNSSKLNTRNIVLTVRINGDVEANRLNLYKYFRTKESCTFYYKNGTLDVSIGGYIETVECGLFTNSETAQISILCTYPYFKSIAQVIKDFSHEVAAFEFPFSINIGEPVIISEYSMTLINVFNASESETGATIEIAVNADVDTIDIKNTTTGEEFALDFAFEAGDYIMINTNIGEKTVTLMRDGAQENLFRALRQGSDFFQLAAGNNVFEYTAGGIVENPNVFIVFKFYNVYRGV